MTDIAEKLANCDRIIEWIDPYDERLRAVTAEPMPNSGGSVRTEWHVAENERSLVTSEVRRLLVPDERTLRGVAHAAFASDSHFEMAPGSGNVIVTFSNVADWHDVFPTDRTRIDVRLFKGQNVWAAVGLGNTAIGLAVFSRELEDGGVQARVQRVPDKIFEALRIV